MNREKYLFAAIASAGICGALAKVYFCRQDSLDDKYLALQPKKVRKFEQKVLATDIIKLMEPFVGKEKEILLMGVSQFLPNILSYGHDRVTLFLPPPTYNEEQVLMLPESSRISIETNDNLLSWTKKYDVIIDIGFRDYYGRGIVIERMQEFYIGLNHILNSKGCWLSVSKKGKIKMVHLNGFDIEDTQCLTKKIGDHTTVMYFHVLRACPVPSMRKYKADFRQCSQRLGLHRDVQTMIEITDGPEFESKYANIPENTILREDSHVKIHGKSDITLECCIGHSGSAMKHYVRGTLIAKRKFYSRRYLKLELTNGTTMQCLVIQENMDGHNGTHVWRMHTLVSAWEKDEILVLGYPCHYRNGVFLCIDEIYLQSKRPTIVTGA